MMNDNTVVIKLIGIIPLDKYHKAVANFAGFVNALTETVATTDKIDWQVTDLHYGSAYMQISAFSTNQSAVREVIAAYGVATRAAATKEPIPYPLSVRSPLEALTNLIDGRITSIEFHTVSQQVTVTSPPPATVESSTKWNALGSVRGKVQTLSERSSLFFNLYDNLFDDAVRCTMKWEQREMMRDIWGKEVIVTGTVTRNPTTGRPVTIQDVIDIEIINLTPLDSYRQVRGILAYHPNDLPSEERIRRLRDDD
jgi:hypothetical protein